MDLSVIKERREDIRDSAPCVGCGATLAFCQSQRGTDPTAPPWFGCCARGTGLAPCRHELDTAALIGLLKEIESGRVRTVDEAMLDSLTEFSARRRADGCSPIDPRDRLRSEWDVGYYAYGSDHE